MDYEFSFGGDSKIALRDRILTRSDGTASLGCRGIVFVLVPSPLVVARHTARLCPSVDVEIAHDADLKLVTSSGAGSMPRDNRMPPASA